MNENILSTIFYFLKKNLHKTVKEQYINAFLIIRQTFKRFF